MRKLQLRLDDLAVVSFIATRAASSLGITDPTNPEEPGGDTAAPPCLTCELSCTRGCDGVQ